jgi:GrpB-like predicted nucleotidyltransferase (UPF0157 family)
MTESVIVVAYDPDWPLRFEEEHAVLAVVFAESEMTIEHIGSTAVPGLGAKPVIDIMVGVSRLAEAEGRIAALEAAGYEYVPTYETRLPERRYFRKPRLGPRAYHLHCVVKDGEFWIRHIVFRDYLRAHPEAAAAYYELKRRLAVRCSKNDYTDAKSTFVKRILASAFGSDVERTAQQQHAADGAARRR